MMSASEQTSASKLRIIQRLINKSELSKVLLETKILTSAGFHHATWMLATDIEKALSQSDELSKAQERETLECENVSLINGFNDAKARGDRFKAALEYIRDCTLDSAIEEICKAALKFEP